MEAITIRSATQAYLIEYFGLAPGDHAEVYEVIEMRDGYRVTNAERRWLVWIPEVHRGALCWESAEPQWTDASNVRDLAERCLISGEMIE